MPMHFKGSNERYTKYPLTSDERPRYLYDYYVTGRGPFPFDMLRYDSAWPVDGESSVKLLDEQRQMRSVHLRSYRAPTVERWASFLWSVGPSTF